MSNEMQLDPAKTVTLEMSNAAALVLHQLLGSQSMASLAQAGQSGLYESIAQQLMAQNQPAQP